MTMSISVFCRYETVTSAIPLVPVAVGVGVKVARIFVSIAVK